MKQFIGYCSFLLLLVVLTACNNNAIAPLSPAVNNNQVNTPSNTNNVASNTTIDSVGFGASWLSSGCSSGITCLTDINVVTNTTVTVCFSSFPTAGSYQLVPSYGQLSAGKAILTVTNPPNQTPGTIWYSQYGNINVSALPGTITATFTNIPCLDSPGSLDSVIVSGQVGCL